MRRPVKITEAHSSLISVYDDWQHLLVNPRFIRSGRHITWAGFEPRILSHPVRASDVTSLADDLQYSFQIALDGSLLHLHYEYNDRGDVVGTANLSFYSAATASDDGPVPPQSSSGFNETGDDPLDEDVTDIEATPYLRSGVSDEPSSWLRIEYAPQDARGVLHHTCHMHISGVPQSRFVVAGIPNPKQFVEFVMSIYYPDWYSL